MRAMTAGACAGALLLAGCSDQSPYKMYVDKIVGVEGSNSGKSYIEADIVGSSGSACNPIQDQASITVSLESPTTTVSGPRFGSYVTGYSVDYYYYDPFDGQLRGPVSGLQSTAANMRLPIGTGGYGGTVTFTIPLVTFTLKAWSVGDSCNGVIGFTGVTPVAKIVAEVVVAGEDQTGKKLSAAGRILVYLTDYVPAPVSTDTCYNDTYQSYWSSHCP